MKRNEAETTSSQQTSLSRNHMIPNSWTPLVVVFDSPLTCSGPSTPMLPRQYQAVSDRDSLQAIWSWLLFYLKIGFNFFYFPSTSPVSPESSHPTRTESSATFAACNDVTLRRRRGAGRWTPFCFLFFFSDRLSRRFSSIDFLAHIISNITDKSWHRGAKCLVPIALT